MRGRPPATSNTISPWRDVRTRSSATTPSPSYTRPAGACPGPSTTWPCIPSSQRSPTARPWWTSPQPGPPWWRSPAISANRAAAGSGDDWVLAALCALGLMRDYVARVNSDLDRLDGLITNLLRTSHLSADRREECSSLYCDLRMDVDVLIMAST